MSTSPLKLLGLSVFFLLLASLTDASAQVTDDEDTIEEYSLRVKSVPNILFLSGGGSYDSGTLVNIPKAPEVWNEYRFEGWKIDGLWANGNPISILMDRPHTAEAIYTKDGVDSIIIDAIPRLTSMTVDGTIYLADELPLSFDWTVGSEHTISISDVVKQTPNTRHKFDSWKDQNVNIDRKITISEDSDEFVAIYKTQHYLKPITEYGIVSGGGWQDEGSSVTFELESDIVLDKKNENIRYVFNSWDLGDYLNSPTNLVDVSEPISVKANWDKEYRLDIITNIDDYQPYGSGWYPEEKQIVLIAEESLESHNANEQYSFERWISKGPNPIMIPNSHEPSTTITMDQPYIVEAHYTKAYRVNVWTPYGSAVGSGFYPEGSTAEITMSQPEVVVDYKKVKKVFSGWDTHGATTMNFGSDTVNSDRDVAASFQNLVLIVDKPINVTANWKTQYYLDVQSTEGKVEGSGWYDLGRLVPISAKLPSVPPGMWSKTVFDKWEGDYEADTPNGRIIMNEPKTVIAEWREDSSPAIVNSIILGSVGGVALIIYSKTRNGKLSLMNSKKQFPLEESGFDKYFNTRTSSFDPTQKPPTVSKKKKIFKKIMDWLQEK